jgi:hypothetical protein
MIHPPGSSHASAPVKGHGRFANAKHRRPRARRLAMRVFVDLFVECRCAPALPSRTAVPCQKTSVSAVIAYPGNRAEVVVALSRTSREPKA